MNYEHFPAIEEAEIRTIDVLNRFPKEQILDILMMFSKSEPGIDLKRALALVAVLLSDRAKEQIKGTAK